MRFAVRCIPWLMFVAFGLMGCGRGDTRPSGRLIEDLESSDPEVQIRAARLLRAYPTLPPEAVPNLLEALNSGDRDVRLAAAGALAKLDGQQTEVVAKLREIQSVEPDPVVRAAIKAAISKIEHPNADPLPGEENVEDMEDVEIAD